MGESNSSTTSTSTTGSSSMCNTSCNSDSSRSHSAAAPLKSTVLEQLRQKQERNAIDSGIESTHKKVSPQGSNTSQGSVLSGHVDMASELQRRCQAAAKLAFKEENKEYKEKSKRQQATKKKTTDMSEDQ